MYFALFYLLILLPSSPPRQGGGPRQGVRKTNNRESNMEAIESYMNEAFKEAFHSVRHNLGGPFGAVIVLDSKIIGKGGNRVSSQNDPTAHAEIVAIRDACTNINHFDLTGAVLYATCEPCPMCLSAIYWANIRSVYYVLSRFEAEAIGFKDNHIYEELSLPPSERRIAFRQVDHPKATGLFREWTEKTDKVSY